MSTKREALHAVKQAAENAGYDDVDTRYVWVIDFGPYHFEYVRRLALWGCKKSDGRILWLDRWNHSHLDKDIFTTELAARNELEKRLYKRLLDLQEHRGEMSRLLVNCPEVGAL